ncbi:MAG TPA: gephyrin-like molybdotransferase Glp, partial [Terriglobales bacterium]|nr:gephyrin-like molybdotransferase Glp [Terriglobales bacterium]
DGYALRAADLAKLPARLEVIGEIKAGAAPESPVNLEPGQAAAIMTGAPAPSGADAIVMVEHTSRHDSQVEITKAVSAGDNIVPVGAEAKHGERLLSPGARLDHAAIAVAASVGRSHLLVYGKPQIAVLSTGDEVVDIDVPPGPNQIRNSNSYSLAAQIKAAGGDPVLLPVAPDEPTRLRELIADGFESDLLLLAGGVSMGKYDLVEQVLAEFQAEFFFTGAQIQPGRPIVFGRIPVLKGHGFSADTKNSGALVPENYKYFFGLPGNPVSTMVTFELFVRPVLDALSGLPPQKLIFLHAKLKSEIKTKTGLKRFLPAILSGEFERPEVELARWQGSGDIAATARANCYVVIPPDREKIAAGEWVPILLR